jgi:NitT/TauT family transport system ATP-binding protein
VAPRVRVSIRDLSKTFGEGARQVPAASPVSFDVVEREFVAIVGPSGCAKSTILNRPVEARLLRWRPEYQKR